MTNTHSQMRQIHLEGSPNNNEIYKISFYSGSSGFVGFDNWVGFTTDSGKTFTPKPIALNNVDFSGHTVNVTFGFLLNGIVAFDANTLIAYGHYGLVPAILRSTNGGNNFKLVFHNQLNPQILRTGITDMVFPENGNTGFAVDADRILKTTDKGVTWNVVKADNGLFYDHLEAVDNDFVIAITTEGNTAFRTQNGGTAWQTIAKPAGHLRYAFYLTASKAWMNVDDKIYYTSNGGTTWTKKNDEEVAPFYTHKMKFINDSTGFALGQENKVYKTTDSGKIWEQVPRDNQFTYLGYTHNDLHFRGNNQFWAGGGHGFLELNSNAGARPMPEAFFKIDTNGVAATNMVNLINFSKPYYSYKWYVNRLFKGSTYHISYEHIPWRSADTVMLIVSDGIRSDTTTKVQYYNALPYPSPVITSFNPTSGGPGTVVTITGLYFGDASKVSFGDIPAASYTVNSSTSITAVVGPGANGSVAVTTPGGTGFLPGFIVYPPPVITSISPTHGPVGTAITITGNNFSAVNGNNIVFVGGVRAIVLTASANQLSVRIPAGAGYAPITVAVNSHIAYTSQRFNITFPSTCEFSEYTFAAAKEFKSKDYDATFEVRPRIGDLDGDGKNDIALITSNGASIFRNTGSPGNINFDTTISLLAGDFQYDLELGDLDGDGRPDLVVSHDLEMPGAKNISIFKNTSTPGNISFAPKTTLSTTRFANEIVIRDLDGDGKADLTASHANGNPLKATIFRNISMNGQIAFADSMQIQIGFNPFGLLIDDIDGDGKADLFFNRPSTTNSSFAILRNISQVGNIAFTDTILFKHHFVAEFDAILSDMNGDGKLDVIAGYDVQYAGGDPDGIATYINTSTPGNVSFAQPQTMEGCVINGPFATGDLDGDNKIDLYTMCPVFGSVSMYKNNSSGGSLTYTPVNAGPRIVAGGPWNAIADIDNDGKPDLIQKGTQGGIGIYRNELGSADAWAGKDTTLCATQSVTLGDKNTAGIQYAWTSSQAGFTSSEPNPVVTPSATTTYYVAVTDNASCIFRDTVRVTIGGPLPAIDAGNVGSICIRDTMQLGYFGNPSHSFSWSSLPAGFSSTISNPKVSPTVNTRYYLTVNTGACIARDTVEVYVSYYPQADAGLDRDLCLPVGNIVIGKQDNVFIYNFSWTSDPPGFTSTYSNPTVSPTVTTKYFLTVSSAAGCKSRDTVTLAVYSQPAPPTLTAVGDIAICQGDSVRLISSADSNNRWVRNGLEIQFVTAKEYRAKEPGVYRVQYYETGNRCPSPASNAIEVVAKTVSPPVVTALGGTSLCTGGSVTLQSSIATNVQWYKNGAPIAGAQSATYQATTEGSYSATAIQNGCSTAASNAIPVTVNIPPIPVITQNGNILHSSIAAGNQWYINGIALPNATGSSYTASASGIYTVRITQGNCTGQASVGFNFVLTGINTPEWNKNIVVAPNPVRSDLLIKYTGNFANFSVSIMDASGKIISRESMQSNLIVDMRKMSNGMYVVKIMNNRSGEFVQRLIVKQ